MRALAVSRRWVGALIPKRVTEGVTSCIKVSAVHRHSYCSRRHANQPPSTCTSRQPRGSSDSQHPRKTSYVLHCTSLYPSSTFFARLCTPLPTDRRRPERSLPPASRDATSCLTSPSSPPAPHMLRDTGQIYHRNDKHKDDAS